MKTKEKYEAIRLRKSGKSYGEIRKKIKVSKSSLTLWLRDIRLTEAQQERIYVELKQKNAYRMAKANQRKRREETKKTIKEAKKEALHRLKNPLFLAGLMLYWAEGEKSDEREMVKFSNSDPRMIKLIMRWFRKECKVSEDKFRVTVFIHKLFCREDVEEYWSRITNIPFSQFYKTQIKPTSLGHRRNKLYNGTCAIGIQSKRLFRRIKGWKLGFLKEMRISETWETITCPRSSNG